MKIESTELILTIGGLLVTVISYFLAQVHRDFRKSLKDTQDFKHETSENLGVLKTKIELSDQKHQLKYSQIEEQTQLKIQNLTDNVSRLANTIEKLLTQTNK